MTKNSSDLNPQVKSNPLIENMATSSSGNSNITSSQPNIPQNPLLEASMNKSKDADFGDLDSLLKMFPNVGESEEEKQFMTNLMGQMKNIDFSEEGLKGMTDQIAFMLIDENVLKKPIEDLIQKLGDSIDESKMDNAKVERINEYIGYLVFIQSELQSEKPNKSKILETFEIMHSQFNDIEKEFLGADESMNLFEALNLKGKSK